MNPRNIILHHITQKSGSQQQADIVIPQLKKKIKILL